MVNRTCFLHVGTVKTGSSALQYALAHLHDELLAKGYNFPNVGNRFRRIRQGIPTGGNADIIRKALHAGDVESAIDVVRQFASESKHLIFSNEMLFHAPSRPIENFFEALRRMNFDVKCLVLFRPQTDVIVSAYLQLVKSNSEKAAGGLAEYVARQDLATSRNWLKYAETLERAAGPDNLTVKWYPAVVRDSSVVRATFDWLGLPAPALDLPTINPTPGRETLAVLNLVNASGFGGRKFADTFLASAQQSGLLGSKIYLGNNDARNIYDATKKSNEELLRRYCPELLPDAELQPPKSDVEAAFDDGTFVRSLEIATDILRQHGANVGEVARALRQTASAQR